MTWSLGAMYIFVPLYRPLRLWPSVTQSLGAMDIYMPLHRSLIGLLRLWPSATRSLKVMGIYVPLYWLLRLWLSVTRSFGAMGIYAPLYGPLMCDTVLGSHGHLGTFIQATEALVECNSILGSHGHLCTLALPQVPPASVNAQRLGSTTWCNTLFPRSFDPNTC